MKIKDIKFELSEEFINNYKNKQPNWGPLGYITYKRTYARPKNGDSENYWETIKRVVEGVYTIQKKHCARNSLPFNQWKAQASAQRMFQLMWDFKFTPPGRGLWMMGTPYMYSRGGAALNNCAFASSENIDVDFAEPFVFLMDMSMLGVGVGGDTKGAGKVTIKEPKIDGPHIVEDTREGWNDITRRILNAFVGKDTLPSEIDYSRVRPLGSPIKGFGGIASGPEPLMELIEDVKKLLYARVGEPITSSDIVDIYNMVGKCVVSGNVRRSAEIMFGEPDDEDFMNLKNPETNKEALMSHRWASNNSIFAKVGMDYTKVAELTAKNGEPGYMWLDNAQKYSRMNGEVDNKDYRAKGGNPSLRAGTKILTKNGICDIETLENKDIIVKNLDGKWSSAKCFLSGKNKQLYKIELKGGKSLYATPEHKWAVFEKDNTTKYETVNLKKGMKLPLGMNSNLDMDADPSLTREDGFMIGWLTGDGWITSRNNDEWREYGFIFNLNELDNAKRVLRNVNTLKSSISTLNNMGKSNVGFQVSNREFDDIMRNIYKIPLNKKDGIADSVWKSNDSYIKGFIEGLFSSDGNVTSKTICLTTSKKSIAEDVVKLLSFYGIKADISYRQRTGNFPNGKDYGKLYDSYRVRINGRYAIRFGELFKLTGYKKERIDKMKVNLKYIDNRNFDVIKAVTLTDIKEDVWDITVYDDTHCFQCEYVITGNCLEQTLEPYELCCLVETYPSNHNTIEEWLETLKYAYMYAKTVTLVPTHNELTNAVMLRNRRIGCSMSGIVQAFKKFGRRDFLNACETGYDKIQRWDRVYSDWLCVPRSIKTTSVKPSGTVSLLSGVTPGIHYPISEYYIRNIRFQEGSPLLKYLEDAGYQIEKDKYSNNTYVVSFPVKEKHFDRSINDVSMWEQLENAAEIQRVWADNQVSVTISFEEHEAKDIKNALELFENKLKGVSFLPKKNHGYEQAPYIPITKADYDVMVENLKKIKKIKKNTHEVTEKYCDSETCEV